jgi:hypothetical protein
MSEQEETLADWIDARAVPNGCALSGALAEGALMEETLETMANELPDKAALAEGLAWLASSLEAVKLLRTVEQSTDRISDLVAAIKAYS